MSEPSSPQAKQSLGAIADSPSLGRRPGVVDAGVAILGAGLLLVIAPIGVNLDVSMGWRIAAVVLIYVVWQAVDVWESFRPGRRARGRVDAVARYASLVVTTLPMAVLLWGPNRLPPAWVAGGIAGALLLAMVGVRWRKA